MDTKKTKKIISRMWLVASIFLLIAVGLNIVITKSFSFPSGLLLVGGTASILANLKPQWP